MMSSINHLYIVNGVHDIMLTHEVGLCHAVVEHTIQMQSHIVCAAEGKVL